MTDSIIVLLNTFYLHGNLFGLISQPTDEMDSSCDKVNYVVKLNSNKKNQSMSNYYCFTSSRYFVNLYSWKCKYLWFSEASFLYHRE